MLAEPTAGQPSVVMELLTMVNNVTPSTTLCVPLHVPQLPQLVETEELTTLKNVMLETPTQTLPLLVAELIVPSHTVVMESETLEP
jgi:hypothetical protein